MIINLENKNALICGSTQGIGKAIAIEMAKAGANVILLARNQAVLEEVRNSLDTSRSQKHEFISADFSQHKQFSEVINNFFSEKRNIHILVNNTGGPPAGNAIDADPEAYLQAFNNHLLANHVLTQHCVKSMKAASYGRIINIISTSVKQPLKGLGVSNTIRAAVANWAKTLSFELAPFGITVNNVLPGATKTQRLKGIIVNKANNSGITEDNIEAEMLREIPAHRFADPEEIAYAAVFLASEQASYINGINVPVDGGRTGCL